MEGIRSPVPSSWQEVLATLLHCLHERSRRRYRVIAYSAVEGSGSLYLRYAFLCIIHQLGPEEFIEPLPFHVPGGVKLIDFIVVAAVTEQRSSCI
ncbi:hypothetical protein GE061_019768 [Apolygus lucorum]|uniref:Uncharacterized protein n=1 Tax=Apolygus lucorum TaxID=248454 RepID=A0A8S9XDE7_APOLU|nr:hypothetical protein GE061_019768 [Apolygus lucorum]